MSAGCELIARCCRMIIVGGGPIVCSLEIKGNAVFLMLLFCVCDASRDCNCSLEGNETNSIRNQKKLIFLCSYRPKTKLRECNVFTRVYHSVHGRSALPCGTHPTGIFSFLNNAMPSKKKIVATCRMNRYVLEFWQFNASTRNEYTSDEIIKVHAKSSFSTLNLSMNSF